MQHKKVLFLFIIILAFIAAVYVLKPGEQVDTPAQTISTPTLSVLSDIQQASSGQEFTITVHVAGVSPSIRSPLRSCRTAAAQ